MHIEGVPIVCGTVIILRKNILQHLNAFPPGFVAGMVAVIVGAVVVVTVIVGVIPVMVLVYRSVVVAVEPTHDDPPLDSTSFNVYINHSKFFTGDHGCGGIAVITPESPPLFLCHMALRAAQPHRNPGHIQFGTL